MEIIENFRELKQRSGSHSPSIDELKQALDVEIKIDACFLSNPYATDLFIENFNSEIIEKNKLRDVLEFYPQQNNDISLLLGQYLSLNPESIFVGNGAIEIIQAILHRFVNTSIVIPIPTFSSYYEFVKDDCEVYTYSLRAEDDFYLNLDEYGKYIRANDIKNVVIINPNNPDGGYIERGKLVSFLDDFQDLESIIIDESFSHFAYESMDLERKSIESLVEKYTNLVVVKSMSKDFGIAGIRAGYGVLSPSRRNSLTKNGYLWNLNGLATYFFRLYCTEQFQSKYEIVRKKYIWNTLMFINELQSIDEVYIVPSKGNFVLLKLGDLPSEVLMITLLKDYGIYVRDCSDKRGLPPGFIRVASRSFEENQQIYLSLLEVSRRYMSSEFDTLE